MQWEAGESAQLQLARWFMIGGTGISINYQLRLVHQLITSALYCGLLMTQRMRRHGHRVTEVVAPEVEAASVVVMVNTSVAVVEVSVADISAVVGKVADTAVCTFLTGNAMSANFDPVEQKLKQQQRRL